MQNWKLSWNMHTLHSSFIARFVPTRMLSRRLLSKISASELSRKSVKSVLLLVGPSPSWLELFQRLSSCTGCHWEIFPLSSAECLCPVGTQRQGGRRRRRKKRRKRRKSRKRRRRKRRRRRRWRRPAINPQSIVQGERERERKEG